jgi:hypothetical protein
MRKLIFIIIGLSIIGCNSPNISRKNIKSIVIENVATEHKIEIKEHSQIAQLLKIINSSKQEFYIFKPDCRITILYINNNSVTLLLNKSALKIDGIPYKTSTKLNDIIETYFSNDGRK